MLLCLRVAIVLLVVVAVLLAAVSANKPPPKKGKQAAEGCESKKPKPAKEKCPEGNCDDPCKSIKPASAKKACYGKLKANH